MSSTKDRRGPGGGLGEAALPWLFIAAVLLVLGGPWVCMWVASRFTNAPEPDPNPITNITALVSGETTWTTAATVVAATLGLLLVVLIVFVFVWRLRRGARGTSIDRAGTHMGRGRDVHELSQKAARKTAQRLGASTETPGLPLGKALSGGAPLFSNWENTIVDIWGTRTGKTTSMAIPSILAAPGACVVTSNKRDIVDTTRGPRAEGGQVWVFDPQGIAGEASTWWWNPLTYITDENRASELAGHFASASWKEGARSDPFWEDQGRDLLSGLLLAARVADRPISTVNDWLIDPTEDEPVRILEREYPRIAGRLRAFVNTPHETRGGIYSNAQQMARCLSNSQVLRWVDPPSPYENRREFAPADFVRGTQTLYSLSKEGQGTAGAMVTALTAAVIDAAVEHATEQPGGRLTTPMVAVLDEAANVCRWAELPSLYSHFGSRGIVLRTILQSWSQGVDVWGQSGMRKLWSAANVKTYGGGVSESDFLRDLSEVIGDFDRMHASVSHSQGRRSVSRDVRSERILDVADLAAMPKGRAIVLASGSRPTLVRTIPWMEGPHAAAIRASIAAHDPQKAPLTTAGDAAQPSATSPTASLTSHASPDGGDGTIRW